MTGFKDPWSDDQKQGESLRRAASELEDKLLVGDKMPQNVCFNFTIYTYFKSIIIQAHITKAQKEAGKEARIIDEIEDLYNTLQASFFFGALCCECVDCTCS